jgi:hypothetical protein
MGLAAGKLKIALPADTAIGPSTEGGTHDR